MDCTVETLSCHHRRHHRPGGFQNLGTRDQRGASLWNGLGWAARRLVGGKTHEPPPVRTPDAQALRRSPDAGTTRVTWIGHSTTLIQTPDVTLLTDPIFSDRASPVSFAGPSRLIPPAMEVDELPPVDVVLLSHDHYDHCDQASLEALHRRHEPVFFVPLGVAARLRRWGLGPVIEMDWWQRATLRLSETRPPLHVTCAPASHFSGRSLFDSNSTLRASWQSDAPVAATEKGLTENGSSANGSSANGSSPNGNSANGASANGASAKGAPTVAEDLLEPDANGAASSSSGESVRIYFGGDSGSGDHFAEIRERLGAPDAAVLPIGAFEPRALMESVHIGPEEAVRAFEVLEAEHFVPIHWGTFDLAEETVQAPAELLEQLLARERHSPERFHVPDPGEVLSLERTAPRGTDSTKEAPVEEASVERVPSAP
jgi:L-ascorbate metabolism protein UlaG (beta-lactamase superfamily)